VEGNRIAEVGRGPLEAGTDVERQDASERLVIPGLINAHTHGHGSLGKGLGDLWTLEKLLNASQWASSGFDYEDCHTAALLNAAEMIRKGATAGYDLFAQIPTPDTEVLAAVARGYADAGVRVGARADDGRPDLLRGRAWPARGPAPGCGGARPQPHAGIVGGATEPNPFNRAVPARAPPRP
jgi:cytosine/adenosine deaminase-related metal-dependent hydrolase